MEMNLYAERDIIDQGDFYARHVQAMTAEGLHAKSDIAAELAHRDIEIAKWRGNYQTALQALTELIEECDESVELSCVHSWDTVERARTVLTRAVDSSGQST